MEILYHLVMICSFASNKVSARERGTGEGDPGQALKEVRLAARATRSVAPVGCTALACESLVVQLCC